jgi:hypothetical protein
VLHVTSVTRQHACSGSTLHLSVESTPLPSSINLPMPMQAAAQPMPMPSRPHPHTNTLPPPLPQHPSHREEHPAHRARAWLLAALGLLGVGVEGWRMA